MSDIVDSLNHSGRVLHEQPFEAQTAYAAAAEITRLRTELAEAQAAHSTMLRECQTLIAERDTLRQQLAVAREGLEEIKLTDVYARLGREEKALRECGQIARDTLAKMEARP